MFFFSIFGNMVTEAMQPGQWEISEGVHGAFEPGVLYHLDIFSD